MENSNNNDKQEPGRLTQAFGLGALGALKSGWRNICSLFKGEASNNVPPDQLDFVEPTEDFEMEPGSENIIDLKNKMIEGRSARENTEEMNHGFTNLASVAPKEDFTFKTLPLNACTYSYVGMDVDRDTNLYVAVFRNEIGHDTNGT